MVSVIWVDDKPLNQNLLLLIEEREIKIEYAQSFAHLAEVINNIKQQNTSSSVVGIITDLKIEHENDGMLTIEYIRENLGVRLPALFVTGGYPGRAILENLSPCGFMAKPPRDKKILEWLAEVIGQ